MNDLPPFKSLGTLTGKTSKLRKAKLYPELFDDVPEPPEWIATEGKDFSGYDFGCEFVWIHFPDQDPQDETVFLHLVGEYMEWPEVSHYMLTDIKTPEPPE